MLNGQKGFVLVTIEAIEGKIEYLKQQNNQLEAFIEVFLNFILES
jgi:hypothetical protein